MRINREMEVEDNVCEVLTMVIEFSRRRHDLLSSNVANAHKKGFIPYEFPVEEFADLMDNAISEHICAERLLLKDGDSIKFGEDGDFDVIPAPDLTSLELFKKDINAYFELQATKISENSINLSRARELLKQRLEAVEPLSV